MRHEVYHNRNGNMHSEEAKEHYHEKKKEVEHELQELREFVEKVKNEDYEHFKTEEMHGQFHVKFKKKGESKYKKIVVEHGVNYDKMKDEI